MKNHKNKVSKRQRKELSECPGGVCAIVHNGDLQSALQVFRRELKQSNKLAEVYRRKEYEKPSVRRRKILNTAKYLNGFKSYD